MGAIGGQSQQDFDEELFDYAFATDDRKHPPVSSPSSNSVPFFLRPTSLLLLSLALIVCNVSLYTEVQRLKSATSDNGFSQS